MSPLFSWPSLPLTSCWLHLRPRLLPFPRHRGRHLIGSRTGGPSPESPRQGLPACSGGDREWPQTQTLATNPGCCGSRRKSLLVWLGGPLGAGPADVLWDPGQVSPLAVSQAPPLQNWAPASFQQFSGRLGGLSPPTSLSPSPPHPVTSPFPSPPLPSPFFPLFFSQHYDDDSPTLHRGPLKMWVRVSPPRLQELRN